MTRAVLGVAGLDVSGLVYSLLLALSPVVGSMGKQGDGGSPRLRSSASIRQSHLFTSLKVAGTGQKSPATPALSAETKASCAITKVQKS